MSTATARLSGAVCSALVAFAIVAYLDVTTQGYWYTFSSILGIAAFAEMGAGQIIMRIVAAEMVSDGTRGPDLGKLRAMLLFTCWYGGLISLAAVATVSIAGAFWIAGGGAGRSDWEVAWLVASIGALLGMLMNFLNSYFEGWQLVARVNLTRTLVSIVTTAATIGALAAGWQLLAFGLSRISAALAALLAAVYLYRMVWRRLANVRATPEGVWRRDFYSLQKRYAATWVTGIIVTSIQLPVIFRTCGADESGRFGMSQAVVNMVVLLASALVGGKQARMAALANSDRAQLDALSTKIELRSIVAYLAMALGTLLVVVLPNPFGELLRPRLLAVEQLAGLLAAGMFWVVLNNYLTYVRSFGQEPFVRLAWAHALFVFCAIYPAAHYLGAAGAVVIGLVGNLGAAIWARAIARGYRTV